MNIERHARIARIKKLSRILRICLTWLGYSLWPFWLLAAVPFVSKGDVTLFLLPSMVKTFPADSLTLVTKIALAVCVIGFVLLMQRLVRNGRDLMGHFSVGDVFNNQAIQNARNALSAAVAIYCLYLIVGIGIAFYLAVPWWVYLIDMILRSLLVALPFFGLLFLLLWVIEIGRDLNEESELTV